MNTLMCVELNKMSFQNCSEAKRISGEPQLWQTFVQAFSTSKANQYALPFAL